jgi:hypothetical protein
VQVLNVDLETEISEAGMPPRRPQFSGGVSISAILMSSEGTPLDPRSNPRG